MKPKQRRMLFSGVMLSLISSLASYSVYASEIQGPPMGETPSVEGCMKMTGLTKDKCQKMMEKFKDMHKDGGSGINPGDPEIKPQDGMGEQRFMKGSHQGNPPGGGNFMGRSHNSNDNLGLSHAEIIQRMRDERAKSFANAEERITKLIEFLKSKDIDTTEIENNLNTFKTKADAVLDKFDEYIRLLKESNPNDNNFTTMGEARNNIRIAMKDMMDFYRSTLRESLITQLEKINN